MFMSRQRSAIKEVNDWDLVVEDVVDVEEVFILEIGGNPTVDKGWPKC